MWYELTTLACPPLELDAISADARSWIRDSAAQGQFLGAWRTEIGALFQLMILRRFEKKEQLDQERQRTNMSKRPFNVSNAAVRISMDSYLPFPFLPAAEASTSATFYEFRTYFLKPGGLAPTLAAWKQAIAPAHDYTSHLLINMYSLDGPPRITHIWQFASLEERFALRARHYAQGLWPPKGGPQQIDYATSTICLPE